LLLGKLPCDFKKEASNFEKQLLRNALDACKHSQRVTAAHLGLSYHQLRNALKKHGLLPAQSDGRTETEVA
jgi:psp operon transcriptional activator